MSKGVKIALWSLATLLVAGVTWGIWYGKKIWNKLAFQDFSITGVNFHGLTLKDIPDIIKSGTSKNITITIGINIKNDNNFSIPFCYLNIKLLYKGVEIARTSDTLANTCYSIPANGVLPISDTINIVLNNAGINMAVEKLTGGKAKIDYEVELNVLHVPSLFIPTIRGNHEL